MSAAGGRLERRYRRLLAAYPLAHRAEYGDEMLGVLLAGARPGQRRPGFGESVNLLASALAARAGRWRRASPAGPWRDAAAVLGLAGAALLAAYHLAAVTAAYLDRHPPGGPLSPHLVGWTALPLAWAAVVVLLLAGWRRPAAALAWLAACLAIALYAGFSLDAEGLLTVMPPMAFGVFTAAAVGVPVARGRGLALAGRFRLCVLVAGALAYTAAGTALSARLDIGFGESVRPIPDLLSLVVLIAAVETVARLAAPVRRRAIVLLLSIGAPILVVGYGMGGMLHETPFYPASTAVLVGEWVAVAGAPVLAFGVGAALLARRERRAGGQGTGQGTRATSA